ncbi:hypothetical protein PanWU01x14_173360 [Parasponia andersonii]|uniref:Uncharacterized protein n=2 Tax=Cannabaceae TaxID=3481 RepID=A0A2P5C8M8_PARAD|nr:hypothetical protein PanWU01x14_173360 [Parasponia andersonii]
MELLFLAAFSALIAPFWHSRLTIFEYKVGITYEQNGLVGFFRIWTSESEKVRNFEAYFGEFDCV